MKCSYLGSLLPSISGAESSCRVFKNRFNPAVTATSFSLSDIEGAILDSESSNTPRRGCRKGLPATFKIWSLLISESPRGRSSRRFCITDKTRRELRFLISSGRKLILFLLISRISRSGNLYTWYGTLILTKAAVGRLVTYCFGEFPKVVCPNIEIS